MKRLLIAIAGAFGLRALLRRRHRHDEALPVEPPVDELRQKLAAAKASEPEPEPEPEPGPEPVETRRADVHEQARRAIDELKEG